MENLRVGIVLAGGLSTRAKVNKLLLEVDRKPLISHTIESIAPFVDKVFVVTGKYHDELSKVIKDAEVIYNKDYEKGMFTSVLTGVRKALGNDILLIPGDIPHVSPSTINHIINGTKPIRVPAFDGKTGHPVYISKELVELLANEPEDSKLCDFIDKQKDSVEVIQVYDEFINFDVDTLEDYEKLRKEFTL